ncbi:DUF5937 family protein [Actinokineospora sp.]|uniref:DUF5937 family protein n=1 Tax=Actinokineospora sp. TaxID=1872133 RepID=UPI0040379E0C
MVAIGFSAGGVARIRFAVSCLWEVVASVRVLRGAGTHVMHSSWVNRVRPRVAGGNSLLWNLIPPAPDYLPDFLTPPPLGLTPDLDAELAVLTATAPDVVRAHLDLYGSPLVGDLYADPEAGLRLLADEIAAYWESALADDWPRIVALLDAEVFRGSRLLAENGAGELLNDLHDTVHWDGDTLSIAQRHCTAAQVPDGSGLVLVPSVFVWPSVLSVSAGESPQLAYPARGIATLWADPPDPTDPLSAVLGRSRARLLAEMDTPTSTTELARRTGMSAGGASQHLAALRAAGLVTSHRQGKRVLSARTTLADALLSRGLG